MKRYHISLSRELDVNNLIFIILLFFMMIPFRFSMAHNNNADSLTLKACYGIAYENYPAIKQRGYNKSVNDLKLKNLNINYYPQISLKGQTTYQSDVPRMTINFPQLQLEVPAKDRYQLTLDLKQTIWDGGTTSSQKEAEFKQLDVDNQKIEVELYSLRPRINDLYFSVLLLQEKKSVNELTYKDIQQRIKEIESRVKNEVVPASNLYILQAQLLQIEQEIRSIDADRIASLKMLSELIGVQLPENVNLVIPTPVINNLDLVPGERPEHRLFSVQQSQFDTYKDVVSTKSVPKFSFIGQAGFGRPGLNFLDNSFASFYTVGLSVSWNPINWNQNNNEIQIYEINKKIILSQQETFDKNLQVSLEKYKSDILKYQDLLLKDEEIISLREKIVNSTYSQLQNGTITSTVYLTELNNKFQSQLLLETHRLQLIQAEVNFLTTKGSY
ncbi:TolC family protein [bacterium]|nr:MAG: TolC family protein [bacterium]